MLRKYFKDLLFFLYLCQISMNVHKSLSLKQHSDFVCYIDNKAKLYDIELR